MNIQEFKIGNYVFLTNGMLTETNIKEEGFSKGIDFTLINYITDSCNIDITVSKDITTNITEIFYIDTNKEITVNKNIRCLENSNLNIVTIEHSNALENKAIINVNTELCTRAKITNKKLALYLSSVDEFDKVILSGDKTLNDNFNVLINASNLTQNSDLFVLHKALDTESKMINFGICKGSSVLNINTNGKVERGAKRANIYQKSKGILLDIESKISANPWLQIDDYDCLASHGAGIGAIDEEELYYLMSRGLTRLDSERLIINGFVNPIYEEIKDEILKEKVIELVKKYL